MLLSARRSPRALDSLRDQPAFVPFDIVLLDPPYDAAPIRHGASTGRDRSGSGRVLAPAGVLVLEHARRHRRRNGRSADALARGACPATRALAFYE